MTINTICALLIDSLKDAGYDDSTIFNYHGVIRRFRAFCEEQGVSDYSSEIGRRYAEDVISQKTGRFSKNRYHTQGRFFRLIDSFFQIGEFDFSPVAKGKVTPDNDEHKAIYKDYGLYLQSIYENKNTIHFYEYGAYYLLQYLNGRGVINLASLDPETVIRYIQESMVSVAVGLHSAVTIKSVLPIFFSVTVFFTIANPPFRGAKEKHPSLPNGQ